MLGSPQQYRSAHATNRMEILNVEYLPISIVLVLLFQLLFSAFQPMKFYQTSWA